MQQPKRQTECRPKRREIIKGSFHRGNQMIIIKGYKESQMVSPMQEGCIILHLPWTIWNRQTLSRKEEHNSEIQDSLVWLAVWIHASINWVLTTACVYSFVVRVLLLDCWELHMALPYKLLPSVLSFLTCCQVISLKHAPNSEVLMVFECIYGLLYHAPRHESRSCPYQNVWAWGADCFCIYHEGVLNRGLISDAFNKIML